VIGGVIGGSEEEIEENRATIRRKWANMGCGWGRVRSECELI
jgi:hypothetical protein